MFYIYNHVTSLYHHDVMCMYVCVCLYACVCMRVFLYHRMHIASAGTSLFSRLSYFAIDM